MSWRRPRACATLARIRRPATGRLNSDVRAARIHWCRLRTIDMKSLENEALGLPSQDRAKLALDLIESLEMLSPVEIEELWAQEAQRRADQIDNLPVALISAEIVSARAHALLG